MYVENLLKQYTGENVRQIETILLFADSDIFIKLFYLHAISVRRVFVL